ncbi:MAG: serine hydrolase [Planctomycetes bacterium]|nr:serine hydrolase [Planctomycetota bacterium]
MKKILLVFTSLILLNFLTVPSHSQDSLLEGLDEHIKKTMEEFAVPGIAIGVIWEDKTIYAKGYGYRDLEKKLPVTTKTLFAIASTSKAFTAAVIGILADKGMIQWDKPIKEYLPGFKMHDSFATERMTFTDLMCHRSGLPGHDFAWLNGQFDRKELFNNLRYLQPTKDFRSTFQYSNLMYTAAGYTAGIIADSSWEELTRKYIFTPLGMGNSNFSVTVSQQSDDYSLPYIHEISLTKEQKLIKKIGFRKLDMIGSAGAINSNVEDMSKWLILNLNKGEYEGKRIISEENLKVVHSSHMARDLPIQGNLKAYAYALGWNISEYRGHKMLSHNGAIDGFVTSIMLVPDKRIGVVVFNNATLFPVSGSLARNIIDRLLGFTPGNENETIWKEIEASNKQAEEQRKKIKDEKIINTKHSHPLSDYAGIYENKGYGKIEIVNNDGKLKAIYGIFEGNLAHYHYDVFLSELENKDFIDKLADQFFNFSTDTQGKIDGFSTEFQGCGKIVFTRITQNSKK